MSADHTPSLAASVLRLRITLHGVPHDVRVESLDEAAPQAATPPPPPCRTEAPRASIEPNGPAAVRSTLAGKVVAVDVRPGQSVAEGAQLATLEAMKMNTYIFAPRDGIVEAVLVAPGDAVEEGQPLLVLA